MAHEPITIDDADLERLQAAGATEVVPEAIEGSLMMASHVLALVGVPMRRVIRVVQENRDARYGLLRGYFHGADDDTVEEREQARLQSVTLNTGAASVGRTLTLLSLEGLDVSVMSIRRANGRVVRPHGEFELADGGHGDRIKAVSHQDCSPKELLPLAFEPSNDQP